MLKLVVISLFVLFHIVSCKQYQKAIFRVYSPSVLKIVVPLDENSTLLAFRANKNTELVNLEESQLGKDSDIDKNVIYLKSKNLDLKKSDVLNYMLLIHDLVGYRFIYSSYEFDGDYTKQKPIARVRREIEELSRESQSLSENDESNLNGTSIESRFGGHRHQRYHWHGHHGGGFRHPHPPNDFGGSGLPNYSPGYPGPVHGFPGHTPGYPGFGPPHGSFQHPKPLGPWGPGHNNNGYNKDCVTPPEHKGNNVFLGTSTSTSPSTSTSTTTSKSFTSWPSQTTTTTPYPEIDIRFQDDDYDE